MKIALNSQTRTSEVRPRWLQPTENTQETSFGDGKLHQRLSIDVSKEQDYSFVVLHSNEHRPVHMGCSKLVAHCVEGLFKHLQVKLE